MDERVALSDKDEWNLLRSALLRNHLQERKENATAEAQAKCLLRNRHRRELAEISLFVKPLGWVMAINRYTRQITELKAVSTFKRNLIRNRQKQESAELERWITQQQTQSDDVLHFEKLSSLLNWSMSDQQRQYYHQALANGSTLVLTNLTKSILWASEHFLTMTGYRSVEVVGKTPKFLQGPATNQVTVQSIRSHLRKARRVEADLINYRKNGDAYLCHLQISPLYNRQGELTHFLAVEYEVENKEIIG